MSGNVYGGRSVLRTKNGHDVLGSVGSVVAVCTAELVVLEGIVGVLWWMQRLGR